MARRSSGLRVLGFGLLLLGMCVFAWGLRYKLSLYAPPHSIARRMPEAKLLTGKDRSLAPRLKLRRAYEPDTPVTLAKTLPVGLQHALGFSLRPGMQSGEIRQERLPELFRYSLYSPVAVRPPPSFPLAS